jgi:hypothetical protein
LKSNGGNIDTRGWVIPLGFILEIAPSPTRGAPSPRFALQKK